MPYGQVLRRCMLALALIATATATLPAYELPQDVPANGVSQLTSDGSSITDPSAAATGGEQLPMPAAVPICLTAMAGIVLMSARRRYRQERGA